jgi:lysophospholipase L1-like esterase
VDEINAAPLDRRPNGNIALERRTRIVRAAAYGSGGIGVAGILTAGLLYGQALLARKNIPLAQAPPPRCDGRYGIDNDGPDVRLVMLGDSSAAGFGVERARETTGALIAAGIAERLHRPVTLKSHAVVGATSAGLAPQVLRALKNSPEIVVILIGANDVTHRVRLPVAIGHLTKAVVALREAGADVVVCTCPDLGTIRPIQPPLRWLARKWSREMAAAQTIAAVSAGARTVSLGDLIGPQFASAPDRMFGADRFHPSAIGYAAAAGAILPTVISALAEPSGAGAIADGVPLRAGEGVRSLVQAAVEAAYRPGTEVSAAQVSGRDQGPAGRWAQLRHRVRQLTERPQDPTTAESVVPLRQTGLTSPQPTPAE